MDSLSKFIFLVKLCSATHNMLNLFQVWFKLGKGLVWAISRFYSIFISFISIIDV